MSADNWAQCPRCTAKGREELRIRDLEIHASYGTVSVEEFDKARRLLAEDTVDFEKRSPQFREDYEIYGAETGTITVSYSGTCEQCGLSLHFRDERPIPGLDKP